MKAIDLLEKHPLSTELVRAWFMQRMIDSIKGDNEVPEDFKNFMLEQGIEDDKMAVMIDANPRMLLDVFDQNDIVIETFLYPSGEFTIKIANQATTNSWKTRKEAETFAIEAAFDILENKLKPILEDEGSEIVTGDNTDD
jgi:hypothetical protein